MFLITLWNSSKTLQNSNLKLSSPDPMPIDLNTLSAHARALTQGQELILLLVMVGPQKLQNLGTGCEI